MENNIYRLFLQKIGDEWFIPYNKNKFLSCGEFTLCADLHELGYLIRKRENGLIKFKRKHI